MKKQHAITIRNLRIISQSMFVILFCYLFLQPLFAGPDGRPAAEYFFYFDPLLMVSTLLLAKAVGLLYLLSLIPLLLSCFLGKFFCGWVCPLGSIQQMVSWLFGYPGKIRNAKEINWLNFKYLVLVFVIASAVTGTGFTGWVDPLSLLSRSLAVVIPRSMNGYASAAPLVTVSVFLLILALSAYRTRFFCNVVCPLGALYGLAARFGIFRLQTNSDCNNCLKCSSHCAYGGNGGKLFMKTECTACFNCLADCSTEAVSVRFSNPEKVKIQAANPGRRSFFGTVALGMTAACIPKIDFSSKPGARRPFMRPPGALDERAFLKRCQHCGQCIQACPTGFIQPSVSDAGIEGLWTPVVNADAGFCAWNCNKCTQVCPSGALEKLTIPAKQKFRIGRAVVDKDFCYTHSDAINCSACQEGCPTPRKAIQFRETESWNYQGRKVMVKQIFIDPDECNGCGICAYVCPRKDMPGITITSEDEYRSLVH